jgi:hypothetical protein
MDICNSKTNLTLANLKIQYSCVHSNAIKNKIVLIVLLNWSNMYMNLYSTVVFDVSTSKTLYLKHGGIYSLPEQNHKCLMPFYYLYFKSEQNLINTSS